jgi:CheY-like chemotaxis protein
MSKDRIPLERLVPLVEDAYEHLYDIVYLRTHPLTGVLVADEAVGAKERAWKLHHLLLAGIDELDPGPRCPAFSREWRRHRLMVLRYVDGLDAQSVASEIGIGRRHYYREHQAAMEAVARLLWDRRPESSAQVAWGTAPTRTELMRQEAARIAAAGERANLHEVLSGVLSLLDDGFRAGPLYVSAELPQGVPQVTAAPNILRQLLLEGLSYLLECTKQGTVHVSVRAEGGDVRLTILVDPPTAVAERPPERGVERLAEMRELAELAGVRLEPLTRLDRVVGFDLLLDSSSPRAVLVVDDNVDAIELYRRFLTIHGYQVIGAETARDGLEFARRLRPTVIVLDLMMPGEDGWDFLRSLVADKEIRAIPVVVCSVLRQKELALSLGAAAFLEKPVSESALLSALGAVVA